MKRLWISLAVAGLAAGCAALNPPQVPGPGAPTQGSGTQGSTLVQGAAIGTLSSSLSQAAAFGSVTGGPGVALRQGAALSQGAAYRIASTTTLDEEYFKGTRTENSETGIVRLDGTFYAPGMVATGYGEYRESTSSPGATLSLTVETASASHLVGAKVTASAKPSLNLEIKGPFTIEASSTTYTGEFAFKTNESGWWSEYELEDEDKRKLRARIILKADGSGSGWVKDENGKTHGICSYDAKGKGSVTSSTSTESAELKLPW